MMSFFALVNSEGQYVECDFFGGGMSLLYCRIFDVAVLHKFCGHLLICFIDFIMV
jgi:hypothetical protein